jgi:hypothetical protein
MMTHSVMIYVIKGDDALSDILMIIIHVTTGP